jgi:hypothetical protein
MLLILVTAAAGATRFLRSWGPAVARGGGGRRPGKIRGFPARQSRRAAGDYHRTCRHAGHKATATPTPIETTRSNVSVIPMRKRRID